MGKKHRDHRKDLKLAEKKLRLLGWRENELGELTHRGSKAEARRTYVRQGVQRLMLRAAERELMDSAIERAREDIYRIEDERVFGALQEAAGAL